MKTIIFYAIIGIVLACSSSDKGTAQSSVKQEDEGKKIYKLNCLRCHGVYGDMQGTGAFDLTVSDLSVEERILVIKNGRNTMIPFRNLLTKEQIEAVAKYTLTLKTK